MEKLVYVCKLCFLDQDMMVSSLATNNENIRPATPSGPGFACLFVFHRRSGCVYFNAANLNLPTVPAYFSHKCQTTEVTEYNFAAPALDSLQGK